MDKSHTDLNTCLKKLHRINCIVLSREVGSSDLPYTPIFMFHQTGSLFHKKSWIPVCICTTAIQAAQGGIFSGYFVCGK